jgi:hypothetical protein
MASTLVSADDAKLGSNVFCPKNEALSSGVSWGEVIGGSFRDGHVFPDTTGIKEPDSDYPLFPPFQTSELLRQERARRRSSG